MSDSDNSAFSAFGKFVPGFDFLQNLATQAAGSAADKIPQLPNLGSWVAPTLNVEELDKRIGELKSVQFWLDQNATALKATIQALEVQKMTLATLKGMNFNLGDMANALKLKAADSVYSGVQKVTEKAASTAKTISDVANGHSDASEPKATRPAKGGKAPVGVAGLVDPLNLWGSLTQQFQQIAAGAMREATSKTAMDMTKNMATGMAKEAIKSAKAAGKKAVAKRTTARKTTARKTTGR